MTGKGGVKKSFTTASAHSLRFLVIILVVSNVFCLAKIGSLQRQINESTLGAEEVQVMVNDSMAAFSSQYAVRVADALEGFTQQIDRRFDTVNANIDVLVKNINDFNETVLNLRNALR